MSYTNYILLDAARMEAAIEKAQELNPRFDSLYRGRSEEDLSAVAPFLFAYQPQSEFANWFMENGWGNSWGVLMKTHVPQVELHRHFRKFLIIGTEDKQELYFRFYDPRVLRIFLPTCNKEQLKEFFGPIDYFVIEDENPAFAQKVWLENYSLKSMQLAKGELLQLQSSPSNIEQKTVAPKKENPVQIQTEAPKAKPSAFPKPQTVANPNLPKKGNEEKPKNTGDKKWNNFFFD